MVKFTEDLLDVDAILNALNIKVGQTVLDAGCGSGYMSEVFSGKVSPSGKVYALDLNDHYIARLKDQLQGKNVEVIAGDITRPTRLDGSSIDLLYIATVVHIFSQQQMEGFVREAMRLLKPDGALAIVEIEKKETPFGPPLGARYAPEELKQIIPMLSEKTVMVGAHFYMQVFKIRRK